MDYARLTWILCGHDKENVRSFSLPRRQLRRRRGAGMFPPPKRWSLPVQSIFLRLRHAVQLRAIHFQPQVRYGKILLQQLLQVASSGIPLPHDFE